MTRCQKKRYPTATVAIGAAIKTSAKWGKPMRHYWCTECKCYHVTSQATVIGR